MTNTTIALYGIETFVQVVEAGNFALAAKRLYVSRSAVGKTIAKLEEHLGVHLFHRTTRKQTLTEDGQAYYEYCVRALAELEAGKALIDSGRQAPAGRLRITAPVLFGRQCVAPILLRLTQQYPELSLEMSFSDRPVDLVGEGFDLAIRIGDLPNSATLAARRLGEQRMVVCASPAYLASQGRPLEPDDLDRHIGVVYCQAGHDVPWRFKSPGGGFYEKRPSARIRFDDLQAMADAAVASAGVAWLPGWLLAPYVKAGELEIVMDSDRVLSTDIHALWPKTRHLAAKTRVAIDVLVAGLHDIEKASQNGTRRDRQ